MNRERAIELLLGSAQPLPSETDAEWSELADFLEGHPELQAWFAAQSPADQALRDSLRAVEPPLLRPTITLPQTGFTRRQWLTGSAAAAASIVGGGAWFAYRSTPFAYANTQASFAGFREDMSLFASRFFRLQHQDSNYEPLLAWLEQRHRPRPASRSDLPQKIASSVSKGCREIDWGKTSVSLICFFRADSGKIVHLFTTPNASLREPLPSAEEMAKAVIANKRECLGWSAHGLVHVLVGSQPGVPVSDLLS